MARRQEAGLPASHPESLLKGLQAAVTIADENGRITYLNDLAVDHYADRGGRALVGTHLDDCHNAQSRTQIEEMYERYRAADLTPTRYHKQKEDESTKSILYIPLLVEGAFAGVAELMWKEQADLVFEH